MKTKKITLRFSEADYQQIKDKAQAAGFSVSRLALQAISHYDIQTCDARKLWNKCNQLSVAEILERVLVLTPINAAISPDEIDLYHQFVNHEGELLKTLKSCEAKGLINYSETWTIRSLFAKMKNNLILKLDR